VSTARLRQDVTTALLERNGRRTTGKAGDDGRRRMRVLHSCLFHEDPEPSASFYPDDGWYYCHGCGGVTYELDDVLRELEDAPAVPSHKNGSHRRHSATRPPDSQIVATYDYCDEAGELLYQTVRYEPKDFRQRRPDARGGWTWSMGNVRRVLYRLPELLATEYPDDWVFVVAGEKDAETLRALGFTSTTNPMGEGKWRDDYSEQLQGRYVVVLPDQDRAGDSHAKAVKVSLSRHAAEVRIVDVPEGKDVTEWVERRRAAGLDDDQVGDELEALVLEQDAGLPAIVVNNRVERELVDETFGVLARANRPPRLFTRNTSLNRVATDETTERPIIRRLESAELKAELRRIADFVRITKERQRIPVGVPYAAVSDILQRDRYGADFPVLDAITETPILRPDGTVLTQPGFDPGSRFIYVPARDLRLPDVPERPTPYQLGAAVELLTDMLCDVPFVSESARANCLAFFLTPVLMPVLRGLVPIVLLDAPKQGSGKGLMADVCSIITAGHPARNTSAPTEEAEWRKTLSSYLASGGSFFIIDNAEGLLRSDTLAAVVTSREWSDRILGRSEMGGWPVRVTWAVTGNNLTVAGDLKRRTYRVRIEPKEHNPHLRSGFKHGDLRLYAEAHRGELLAALLTMCRAWYAAGQPDAHVPAFGSFERWSHIIGGILRHAGINGFLGELSDDQDAVSEEDNEWAAFLAEWLDVYESATRWAAIPGGWVTASQVAEALDSDEGFMRTLPGELAEKKRVSSARSFATALGTALGKHRDARYDEFGLRIEGKRDSVTKVMRWRVVTDQRAR
jgi:hypothetical protein